MTSLTLRPYQTKALEEIRALYARGEKRSLLHLATGGGKTLIFCTVLKSAAQKGKKAIMAVRGKDLVDQASQRLFREGVDHGVLQGNHWNVNPMANVQVCSIDTLFRRKIIPDADLVVIDECHFAVSNSFRWFLDQYKDKFILGVSATPHVKDGLRHVADHVVYPITIAELIEQGYLVPPKYFAPTKVDLSGVKMDSKTGDYQSKSLTEKMSDAKIFGNITDAYLNQARGRPTVCFAVSIKHSLALVEEFKSKGVTAEHIEAGTSAEERRNALSRLESGATEVICNVGILTTGVDMPYVSTIILARPTKSYNLFIQMLGRGTRTFSGKKDFLVLDHGNNVMEHGFIEDEMQCDLDGVSKPEKSERIITCKECYLIFSFEENQYVCPECGHDNTPPKRMGGERTFATDEDYSMVELSIDSVYNQKIVNNFVSKMIGVAIKRNLKPGWVYHQLKKTHGEFAANKNWQRIKQLVEGAQRSSR